MRERDFSTVSAGFQGRHKRKRAPELSDLPECSPDLLSLHKAITKEVETLEELTCAIEEAETDEDQPIIDSAVRDTTPDEADGRAHEEVSLFLLPRVYRPYLCHGMAL